MSLSIDISAVAVGGSAASSSVASASFTTSLANDILVATLVVEAAALTTVSSISDTAGLTWNKKLSGSVTGSGSLNCSVEIWWAYSAAALSSAETVTATLSGTADAANIIVTSVNGCTNFSQPWDLNANATFSQIVTTTTGLPHSPYADPVLTLSSNVANTMVVAIFGEAYYSDFNRGPDASSVSYTRNLTSGASSRAVQLTGTVANTSALSGYTVAPTFGGTAMYSGYFVGLGAVLNDNANIVTITPPVGVWGAGPHGASPWGAGGMVLPPTPPGLVFTNSRYMQVKFKWRKPRMFKQEWFKQKKQFVTNKFVGPPWRTARPAQHFAKPRIKKFFKPQFRPKHIIYSPIPRPAGTPSVALFKKRKLIKPSRKPFGPWFRAKHRLPTGQWTVGPGVPIGGLNPPPGGPPIPPAPQQGPYPPVYTPPTPTNPYPVPPVIPTPLPIGPFGGTPVGGISPVQGPGTTWVRQNPPGVNQTRVIKPTLYK